MKPLWKIKHICDKSLRNYLHACTPFISLLLLVGSPPLFTQPLSHVQNYQFSGNVSTFSEWYHGTNNITRRPGTSGRVSARPTLSLWEGKLNIRGDLLLSSEGDKNRQDINNYGFSADWAWGMIEAGDYAPQFTPLTVTGISSRGFGLTLHPGKFFMRIIDGKSERSTYGATNDRSLWGFQIGAGHPEDTHFHFQMVKVNETAIKQKVDEDTLYFDPWASTTPQENLVSSIQLQLNLPKRLGKISGEIAGSLHSQDKEAEAIDLDEIEAADAIPGFLKDLFKPTISSHADYAYTVDSNLRLKIIKMQFGYYYIGSGYASLGVGSLLNDRKGFKSSLSSNLLNQKLFLRLGLNRYQNNLIGQKPITTTRNMINGSMTYRMSINTNALLNVVWSNAEGDSISSKEFTYKGIYITGGMISRFMVKGKSWSWQLMASHQGLESSVGQLQFIDNYSQSVNANLNATLTNTISVIPDVSFIFPQGETATDKVITNGGAKMVYRLPSQKMRFCLGGTYGAKGTSSNTGIRASMNWHVTRSDNFTLNLRHYFSRNSTLFKKTYNESVANISYSRRF